MACSIVGWSHVPFGRHTALTLEELIVRAAKAAIAHSTIDPLEIGGSWLGNLNGGFVDSDFLPLSRRDFRDFAGPKRAWTEAYAQAGCSIQDLSFAEVHDCFTIAELLSYEAMGLAPKGQGASAIDDGTVYLNGRLPVYASGG